MYIPWLVLLAALVAWRWQVVRKNELVADAEKRILGLQDALSRTAKELDDFELNIIQLIRITQRRVKRDATLDALTELENLEESVPMAKLLTPTNRY